MHILTYKYKLNYYLKSNFFACEYKLNDYWKVDFTYFNIKKYYLLLYSK